jgi:myo-inositol-1(or 4)-monophosphatase
LTDWLELCRAAVGDVDTVLERLPTRVEREPVVGAGLGGDDTTAIDQAAEEAILARIRESAGAVVSEEVGRLGGSGLPLVVVDPIDGSLNAKRGIPFFSLSIAVAEGETMDDVVFGFVHDFGSREEWTARRGEGAQLSRPGVAGFAGGASSRELNGERLGAVRPKDEVEILSFEATRTSLVAQEAPKVADLAYRLRIMGSLALSLCHLAAGRVDAVCSLKPARSVDIAAAQLLCRELGLAVDLFDVEEPFGAAPLDLEQRSRVVAAGSEAVCHRIAAALQGEASTGGAVS